MPTSPGASAPVPPPPGGGWPAFHRLWLATAAANLADGFLLAVVPLLALTLTRDPVLIGAVTAARFLPWLLCAIPAGVLADTRDRSALMRGANLLRAAGLLALAALVSLHLTTLPLLLLLVVVLGAAETLYDTTSSAAVPSLVDDRLLERANGRLQATYTLANSFVGPPLGGFLFGAAASAPLLLGAGGYAVAFGLLLAIPVVRATGNDEIDARARGWAASVREGWRAFRGAPTMVGLCVLAAVGNVVSAATYALVPLFVVESLGEPPATFGLVLAGGAVGATLGGLTGDRVAARLPPGFLLLATTVGSGVAVAAFAAATHPALLAALMALDGYLVLTQSVVLVSTRARLCPPGTIGRVTAVFRAFSLGAGLLGGLAGGVLASVTSVRLTFVVGGLVVVLLGLALARPLSTRRLSATVEGARASGAPDDR